MFCHILSFPNGPCTCLCSKALRGEYTYFSWPQHPSNDKKLYINYLCCSLIEIALVLPLSLLIKNTSCMRCKCLFSHEWKINFMNCYLFRTYFLITIEASLIISFILQAFGEEKVRENHFKQNLFSRPWEQNPSLCLLGNWNQKEPVQWIPYLFLSSFFFWVYLLACFLYYDYFIFYFYFYFYFYLKKQRLNYHKLRGYL